MAKEMLVGADALVKTLAALAKGTPAMAGKALYREAERIMTDSKANYVPVAPDGGKLRASGLVQPQNVTAGGASVTMGYGGAAAAYALAVHEHLSMHSPPSWIMAEWQGTGVHWHLPGRGPKYLELPFNAARKGMDTRLAAAIRKDIAAATKA